MDLQTFLESTAGQIVVILIILIIFALILLTGKGEKHTTKTLTISAILIAMSIVLNQIVLFRMPQGGSITAFSMVPIVLCGYLLGLRRGVMAGICVGLIDLIFNPYVIHPLQMLLDYPLAFGALAFGAIFAAQKHGLIKCYLFGVFCRYICATVSGVVFFGSYAPEGFNGLTWSLWYNLTYLGAEAVITVILLSVPAVRHTFEKLKV